MKKLVWFVLSLCCASAMAQVAVSPWKSPHVTFSDQNGVPLAGGCVFTYLGGTSTQEATYTDSTGNTPNANPVILDASGSANIWLGPVNYKFAIWSNGGINCASGALQWTVDEVPGNVFNNVVISGGTWTGGTITGAAISGGTITGTAITDSTIDSSPVGQTTPSTGSFTSLASGLDAMTFSSTPVFNAGSYGYFTMTLTNNVTSSTITGGLNGQELTWNICQNGTGQTIGGITTGFTFAWPTNLLNAPPINPILNSCTIVNAYGNGGFWYVESYTPQVVYGNFDTVPYSATPIFPAASYSNFAITLTGNVASSTLTGGVMGQIVTLDICQNGTGGNTFVWPTNLLNAPTVSAGASSCTGATAVYNGTNWQVVANSSVTSTTPLTGNLDTIPFTATPIFSTQNFSSFAMTLSGNVTSSSISGGVSGQLISIVLTQGSSSASGPGSAPTFSTLTTGGNLPGTTTYYAKCTWLTGTQESLPSSEASETTGSGATNSITWNCPVGAGVTGYKFYIGTGTGAENYWFTTSSASYIQIGVPSTGTPGLPPTSSTYTVSWPANLINPPVMANGLGATTGLIALYNGTNWVTVGTSGSGSNSVQCSGGNCYRANTDGSYEEWGTTPTFGGQDGGSFSMTWPHAFTNLASITAVFSPTQCDSGGPSTCAANPGGSSNNIYACFIETASLTAPTVVYSSSNTVTSPAACYFHVIGY
ncbi:hypothetical protein ACFPT7_02180 [Acidicapsa dinghuensis]|uniref:DUF3494 domain-containing protein n=1 Tax=Acidicapsa dinghuensis TaxID=2218256 RepID=A0ABW1EAK2_9BACT|nr:hypothetical protein [Acidicapsa dinghuensis]